jgi:hypothetical protein
VKISIQEIVQKTADEVLDNATINNIPFREWIDNVNNAYANKKCNLTPCRYNENNCCTNCEKRTECVEVSKKVLCVDKKTFRKIDNVKHIGNKDGKPIETFKLHDMTFGVDVSVDAVNEYAKSILGRYPKDNVEFSRALEVKILEETKSLANSVKKGVRYDSK